MKKHIKAVVCAGKPAFSPKKDGAFIAKKDGDAGDAASFTDTSTWSTSSGQQCDFNSSPYSSDFEDLDESEEPPEAKSFDMGRGPKPSTRQKRPQKQKTNHSTSHLGLTKLPPLKFQQVPKPKVQPPQVSSIRDLKSQVWDLQLQLSEAQTENKLLKRVQHRHTVALQHFQHAEGSLSQILAKHNNEVRVLQGLLRETRACRDNLARQLQYTENKLMSAKASLVHLQLLNENHSLLEREELSHRLTKAKAQLEDKNKRIGDLERNLELCQASFNRQIVTEHKKFNEARKISCYLQEQIYGLNREIQERERELETRNIYSHRLVKGVNKKGTLNKMVQTEVLVTPRETKSVSQSTQCTKVYVSKYTETEKLEEQETPVDLCSHNAVQESLVIENPEEEDFENVSQEDHQDTETCADIDDTSEQNICSETTPEPPAEVDCVEENEASEDETSEAPLVLEEEEKTGEHDSEESLIAERSANSTEPKRTGYQFPKFRRNYTFKQSIENLHSGKPAYSSADSKLCERQQPWEG